MHLRQLWVAAARLALAADENVFCPAWAKAGECASNPDFMHRMCGPSCGIPLVELSEKLLPPSAGLDTDPNLRGPYDCHGQGCEVTGTHCHNECECRHLDNIERLRFSTRLFQYPRKPSLVITASPDGRGTASTWAFNAVRLLYRQARQACDSYWIRHLTVDKLKQRLRTGAHVVVKTHEWTGYAKQADFDSKLLPLFTHVILSRRKGRQDDPGWVGVATHVVDFDEIVVHNPNSDTEIGALNVLRRLAKHLGITSLSENDYRAIDHELMSLPVPSGFCNQTTKFWPHHARRGGRPPSKS